MVKSNLKYNKVDFKNEPFAFLSPIEIEQTLSFRLRQVRLFQKMKQSELAEKSGLSLATIKKFETGSTISFQNFLKIILALNLKNELEKIFLLEPQSISDFEAIEQIKNKPLKRRVR